MKIMISDPAGISRIAHAAERRPILWHVTEKANLPGILARGLEPRIGPRSSKIPEDRPAVYLFYDRDDVDDALMNWLGDELDGDLVLLEIKPPQDLVLHQSGTDRESDTEPLPDLIRHTSGESYELLSYDTIAPDCIISVQDI